MKRITNLTQGPRQLQITPKGADRPKFLTLSEGGTSGATIEVSDADWEAIQAAPVQGTQPRLELVQVKRLGQVVVGPCVQAQDLVPDGSPCGEDEDW